LRGSYRISIFDLVHDTHVVAGKGPQPNANASTYTLSKGIPGSFCKWFERYIDRRARYSSSDVDWWLGNVPESKNDDIPCMFASVHQQVSYDVLLVRQTYQLISTMFKCLWYHCLPTCDVWRKAILQHCEREGWRVPTAAEIFQDRFKKRKYMYGANKQEYPLRDSPGGQA
jgi:hypothetical protein